MTQNIDDLIARLESQDDKWYCREAAAAIRELQAENARLTDKCNQYLHASGIATLERRLKETEAERDALAAAMPSEGADAALAYAAMKTERDALRAEIAQQEQSGDAAK